jgi:aspartyl-tRNA(Asn)/glutamyl-tRNA(Gln) amidotransferase subunit A
VNENQTISDAAQALRAGTVSSVELVTAAIEVADAVDGEVGTFLNRFVDESLAAAQAADRAIAAGEPLGPLHGIPLGIKDIITTSEAPSTAQSVVMDPAWSHGDAVVVSRLRGAGGVIMGKTSTMEYASGLPDASKPFPLPRNPWDLATWPGGSSSGTGSGVAAGMFLGGLGTDTGGSIRIPAAFCGITGLMPTFGRVPKSGCVPLGYTLDHIGPMARSARDCAVMLNVLAGYDASDVTAIDTPVPDYLSALTGDLTGLRIGVDRVTGTAGRTVDPALDTALDAAIAQLSGLGAEIVTVELPFYEETVAGLMVIVAGEALAYHLPDARVRLPDYVASNRLALAKHTQFTGADYVQAQRARRVTHRSLMALMADVDLILTPTAFVGAIPYEDLDRGDMDWFSAVNTSYWDSVGCPVISVPIGFTAGGLPLAMQLAGRPFEEGTALRAADAFQQATAWHLDRPSLAAPAA